MEKLRGRNVRVREGQWHYRFNLNGQECTGPTGLNGTARNRKEAEQFAVSERRRIAGEQHRAEPTPFDRAAGEFITWCKDVEYRGKRNTALRIETSFKSAVAFFEQTPVQQIDAGAIERYKAHRIQVHGVRDITLRHDLHALSVFFKKYATKMGWAVGNPVHQVSIPSDKDAIREHVLTADEESKYFEAAHRLHEAHLRSHPNAQPNLADVARLMVEQGCRPEEIMSARKESFDGEAKTLRILGGKTKAARRILNLTAASVEILQRRLNTPGPWLFPSDRRPGHHLTKLQCTHDRACIEAGVSFVLYDFRHTWATRAIEAGNDAPTVAAIMGHSGLRTIFRYVHPTSEAQKLAMERFETAQQRKKLKVVK